MSHSPPPVTVSQLPSTVAATAGRLFARAFQDDPIQVALEPDPMRRARVSPDMFTAEIRSTLACGGVLTGTSDGAGAALWTPPGVTVGARGMLSVGWAMPRAMLRSTPSSLVVGFRLFREMPRRRRALVPEPHWYLATLGVVPTRHGRGLGTLLVRHGLERADREGRRTYLETETESNVRFYEGLGFTVLDTFTIRGLGLPMWLMARAPGHR